MNNDLISRSALKTALNYIYDCAYIESKSKEGIASDIIDDIDNAPTVPLPDFKEGYKQAIIDGKTNFSRPQGEQGEWIEREEWNETYYECSVCKEPWCTLDGTPVDNLMNYCPCCGAKMQGVRKNEEEGEEKEEEND